MKTLDQIYRYTKDCEFPEEDWNMVLEYCRKVYSGGKIHKAVYPKSKSTYNEFLEWIENGFGSGDFVFYGNVMGIVGDQTPERTYLMAHVETDGTLVSEETEVNDPSLLSPLDEYGISEFRRIMVNNMVDYDVRLGKMCEMYTPKEYDYIIFKSDKKYPDVGIFLESDKYGYHFLAYLSGNSFELDYYMPFNYTPIRPAKDADINRFLKTALDNGYSFNKRARKFSKVVSKKRINHYWYINDRFQMVSEVDNGTKKHAERFAAGNYFTDQESADRFMEALIELAKQYE